MGWFAKLRGRGQAADQPAPTQQVPKGGGSKSTIALHKEMSTHSAYARNVSLHPKPTPELSTYGNIKLGWIQGVLIPCLLNIWGVMLFLRIAWVVAQAGIIWATVIVFISAVVCVITALSLSAICTNGELEGGGVYFLVSRSLGAELGASVGIIFAFANAVAASMNTIGFCESLNELLKSHDLKIVDNSTNDTRIVGAIALLVMCLICAIGMDWETKAQNILIILIVAGIMSYYIGVAIGPTSDTHRAQGFVGVSLERAKANLYPDYRYSENQHHNFFSVFSIYFPAVTGVQAGANICGDLKDPASAIPKGTLLALAISSASYLSMTVLAGSGAMRDASGNVTDLDVPGALESCAPDCEYGLHNNYQIMHTMAFSSVLIYLGCWAATLSTALTNLLSVPRLIQALGRDHIYPGLIFFSKPYGRHGEPYRGYVITFIVSLLFLLIADLNTIAPLITNFYLASYALINFCTFHAAFIESITWRPGFRYYNTWVSLMGCLICVVIMIIISWTMTLITAFIFIVLYLIVHYRKPVANWGSSTDAQKYQDTVASILSISQRPDIAKYYNPQPLVLAGPPKAREWLVDVAQPLIRHGSFMILADIRTQKMSPSEKEEAQIYGEEWVAGRQIRAFYLLVQGLDFHNAMLGMFQCCGLGKLSPNMAMVGFKENWQIATPQDLVAYYQMLQLTFELKLALCVTRVPPHMRKPDYLQEKPKPRNSSTPSHDSDHLKVQPIMYQDSDLNIIELGKADSLLPASSIAISMTKTSTSKSSVNTTSSTSHRHQYKALTFSQTLVKCLYRLCVQSSTLDAWCLYDDGGMNILLPYIIARNNKREKMALRIYMLAKNNDDYSATHNLMAEMLKKYRIDYSELILVTGLMDPPSEETWNIFNNIIHAHKTEADSEILISAKEFDRLREKTQRHLRLRELVIQNSLDADLIVISLPYPRQGSVSAAMYLAWLEILSQNMPPVMFIRGSTSVLDA